MKIYIEGPDGIGKSTLVEHIIKKYKYKMIHSSNLTENDYKYHSDLIDSEDNLVLDRFNLGEIVYPAIYNRKPKMTFDEQLKIMFRIEATTNPFIIFFASNFDDLKERLFKRGDSIEVLENAERINLCFKLLAEQLSSMYDNVYALDISKESDQIKWFEDNISERIVNISDDNSSSSKSQHNITKDNSYQYITISSEADTFQASLTQASIDGWELVSSNSFPVQKPDMLKSTINVVIIYTAILRRKIEEEIK